MGGCGIGDGVDTLLWTVGGAPILMYLQLVGGFFLGQLWQFW
jgi:hypothetical protein